MPTFRITGPDGATYKVTAPDGASEQDILSYVQSQASSASVPSAKQPEMTAGEVAGDVAKSAGIGVVQGGIGLATMPGNLEALGRAGINAAAGMAGAKPPLSSETFLPTYSDWKRSVEDRTGEFYKPKTTLGEYARAEEVTRRSLRRRARCHFVRAERSRSCQRCEIGAAQQAVTGCGLR